MISIPARSQDILWGLTSNYGPEGAGTAFSLRSTGTDFTIHFAFGSDPKNGYSPTGNLIEGSDGYFYGMTNYGGEGYIDAANIGYGTIFKIGADGSGFTVLKRFNGSDGDRPYGSLIEGSDGYFYGMTSGISGGASTIFKIAPNGSGFTVLKTFHPSTDGTNGQGSLIEGSDGYFYGMTSGGGINQGGTIFKIAPNGSAFTLLKSFFYNSMESGYGPSGSLTEGSDGYFYGMSGWGGASGYGTIFKIRSDGSGFIVLRSFNGSTEGAHPFNKDLIEGSDGFFYGITQHGGDDNSGIIFKISPDGTDFSVIKSFNYSKDGAYPQGNLIEDSDGNFYGMTLSGGDYGAGTIFKIAPNSSAFTVLRSLNPSTEGSSPAGSLIIQKVKLPLSAATKVNFQSKWPTPPQGWIKDYGLAFGEKTTAGKTLTYGWKRRDNGEAIDLSLAGSFPGNPGNGRLRTSPSDILLATLMHMQGNHVKNFRGTPVESYWEMAVANGDYQVTVSVGDGSVYTFTDLESHSINVEGVAAITHFIPQGTQGSLTRFKQATVKVRVTDGFLTLDADGGRNTKINYAVVQPLITSTGEAVAKQTAFLEEPVEKRSLKAYPNPFQDKFSLDLAGQRGKVTITVVDLTGKPYYQTVEQLQDGILTVDLSAGLKAGIYFIKLQSEDGTSQVVMVVKR